MIITRISTFSVVFVLLALPFQNFSQVTPELSSWIINQDESTGFNDLPSNVQSVDYTDTDVFVSCSCIPGYDIGPWVGNPNTPANQDFCFKITRNPVQSQGYPTYTSLGHIGVWSNGVSIFNAKDAFSFNNLGVWFQDAYVFEGASFDECLGHPAGNGEYHHHVNPTCLYDDSDEGNHSPIIGYAFDGYPVYGAFAFTNLDGTGEIIRMTSSYALRDITVRETLPSGFILNQTYFGPEVNSNNPLGNYIEDYEYIAGLGTLDAYNGRFCVTPEYPLGTFAYFVTIDEWHDPVYPYSIGPAYFGIVQSGNTGPQSAHNVIPDNSVHYDPAASVLTPFNVEHSFALFPNPASLMLNISVRNSNEIMSDLVVTDLLGNLILSQAISTLSTRNLYQINTSNLPTGFYFVTIGGGTRKFQIIRE
jgi:hypothetical protein